MLRWLTWILTGLVLLASIVALSFADLDRVQQVVAILSGVATLALTVWSEIRSKGHRHSGQERLPDGPDHSLRVSAALASVFLAAATFVAATHLAGNPEEPNNTDAAHASSLPTPPGQTATEGIGSVGGPLETDRRPQPTAGGPPLTTGPSSISTIGSSTTPPSTRCPSLPAHSPNLLSNANFDASSATEKTDFTPERIGQPSGESASKGWSVVVNSVARITTERVASYCRPGEFMLRICTWGRVNGVAQTFVHNGATGIGHVKAAVLVNVERGNIAVGTVGTGGTPGNVNYAKPTLNQWTVVPIPDPYRDYRSNAQFEMIIYSGDKAVDGACFSVDSATVWEEQPS